MGNSCRTVVSRQFLVEVDHSSGHDKFKPDGLNVHSMAAGVGGKSQKLLRTSKNLTADCLGTHAAVVKRVNNAGKVIEEWNVKLKAGDDQPMVFQKDDPPPFKNPDAKPEDYVGKAKGITQVLFERGLLDPNKKYTLKGNVNKAGDHDRTTSKLHILQSCPDFANEVSLLEQLVIDRGHILLSSPKCHPELAGDGIEYGWGQSKRYYRRNNPGSESEMARHQRERVFASIHPDNVPRERLMRYSRTAREYKLVYFAENGGEGEIAYIDIETKRHARKLKRAKGTHRSIPTSELKRANSDLDSITA